MLRVRLGVVLLAKALMMSSPSQAEKVEITSTMMKQHCEYTKPPSSHSSPLLMVEDEGAH
jgi:hypothetical protein